MLEFIPAWEVAEKWGAVVGNLRKVLNKQSSWDEKSIYNLCLQGQMHLWEVPGEAVFVTQIQTFPLERLCVVVLAGGTGLSKWRKSAIEKIEQYARGNGCNEIAVCGRKGWERAYPGLEPNGEIVMRKKL